MAIRLYHPRKHDINSDLDHIKNNLDLSGYIAAYIHKLKPTSEPTTPEEGDMYYDSADKTVYFYNGTGWIDVAAGVDWTNIPSDILPSTDDTYSVGSSTKRWKDGHFSGNLNVGGTGTFNSGLVVYPSGNTIEVRKEADTWCGIDICAGSSSLQTRTVRFIDLVNNTRWEVRARYTNKLQFSYYDGTAISDLVEIDTSGNLTVGGNYIVNQSLAFFQKAPGKDITQLTFNAWYDGSGWHFPDSNKYAYLYQLHEDNGYFAWYFRDVPGGATTWTELMRLTNDGSLNIVGDLTVKGGDIISTKTSGLGRVRAEGDGSGKANFAVLDMRDTANNRVWEIVHRNESGHVNHLHVNYFNGSEWSKMIDVDTSGNTWIAGSLTVGNDCTIQGMCTVDETLTTKESFRIESTYYDKLILYDTYAAEGKEQRIVFRFKDSAGNMATYGNIICKNYDWTDGSEDGRFYWQLRREDSLGTRMYLTEAGNLYVEGTYNTFSPRVGDTESELVKDIESEVHKPDVLRDEKGRIVCPVCGKSDCMVREHQEVLEKTYGKDIGKVALATGKLILKLLERIEQLEVKIGELEKRIVGA